MLETFKNTYKVTFSENANVFIYLVRKLPIIGKLVSEELYKRLDAKQTIGIVVQILLLLAGFVKATLYLLLVAYLPARLFSGEKTITGQLFFQILFFLSFLAGPLLKSTFLNRYDKKGYKMVVLMRADARSYMLSTLLFKNMTGFVYFVVPLLVMGMFIGYSPVLALMATLEIIAARLMGEWLQLAIYDRFGLVVIESNIYGSVMALLLLAAAYGLPFAGFIAGTQAILGNMFVFGAFMVLGSTALAWMLRYQDYHKVAKAIMTRENVMKLGSLHKEMKFGDVKINEKKMDKTELQEGRYLKKEGYEYLNHLFFRRHRRLLLDPILKKTAIVGAISIAGVAAVLYMPSAKAGLVVQLPKSTPMLVFVMYFMSNGEKICRAMFHNCDVSLLRYSYYREGRVILSNFISRLKRVILINLIPALALSLGLLVVSMAGGMGADIIRMVPVVLCVLCLACFFSIHHLFMYYVIQPYTAELTVRSPLFIISNLIVYLACFGSLQLKTSSQLFALCVIAATAVYMGVALVLTFRLAPKTFRLK